MLGGLFLGIYIIFLPITLPIFYLTGFDLPFWLLSLFG